LSWVQEPNEFEWVQDLRELSKYCEMKGVLFDRSDQNGTVRRLFEKLQEEVEGKKNEITEDALWNSLTDPVLEKCFLLLKMKPIHSGTPVSSNHPAADAANPFALHRTVLTGSKECNADVLTEKSLLHSLLERTPSTPSKSGRIQKSFTDFPETEQAKALRNRQIRTQHIDQVSFEWSFYSSIHFI
jgi:hypothetical protein